MRMTLVCIALVTAILTTAGAQTVSVDHYTQGQLAEMAQALSLKAQGPDGAASTKVKEYPNHFTMISLRHKNGGAEIHQGYADFFLVVEGRATLLTGGTVPDGKVVSPGETRGAAVLGGTKTELNQGDVVHIPAGVPHQLLIADGSTFVYFVIKVREK